MSKIGKVTVKHYLEKKVKPIEIYGDTLAYPVYVRITVNRRTTQLRSITETLMSEKAFEYYRNTNEVYSHETKLGFLTLIPFKDEPQLIKLSIETLAEKESNFDFSDRNVRKQLNSLLTSARETFINIGRIRQPYVGEAEMFISSFNQNLSVIHVIKLMEPTLKIDLRPFFPTGYLKKWQVIELVKCINIGEMTFIELYHLDYMKKFLKALRDEKCRKYCLIDETFNIDETDVRSVVNQIIKDFFVLIFQ